MLICLFCFVWEPKRALTEVEQSFPQPSSLNDELSRAWVIIEVSRAREYQSCHFPMLPAASQEGNDCREALFFLMW